MKVKNLGEVIKMNNSFKTAINLYLSLNKKEKILNYIPTKSSLNFMDGYLRAVIGKKEHATLLVGPYGKGKSHLLLVLLAILSMERNYENSAEIIEKLKNRIKKVEDSGEKTAEDIQKVWNGNRFLPVIVNDSKGDLNQAFLLALNDALKRDNLSDLAPDTYFSEALRRIDEWKREYPDTYKSFVKELKKSKVSIEEMVAGLTQYSKDSMNMFRYVYPKITAGSSFNPLAESEVIPLYKSVSEMLVEEHGYSGIYIVFDEFSKFIEGLDGRKSGNAMKLLQDMCELASDSSDSQIYITMVAHKSIKEYGKYLSPEIINAFTGIEGRIVEKYFVTSSKNNYELIRSAIIKDESKIKDIPGIEYLIGDEALNNYYQLPVFKSNFSRADFDGIILKGCYPLNPISSYLLLNISEKVAQNERTLFTFISNDEPHSMARFVSEHTSADEWSIGAELVYDYFSGLFKKDITNELIHNLWLSAEYALGKCQTRDEKRLIKTLAVILIVNKNDEIPADEKYLALSTKLEDANGTINELVNRQIIYKKSSIGSYVFKTKAGSELKAEIKKRRELKGNNVNYSKSLEEIMGKHYLIPRRYNAETMMTRYFRHEYMDVDTFLNILSPDALFDKNDVSDGKVITLYGLTSTHKEKVKEHFKELNCDKLVVVSPDNTISGTKSLKDYEIIQEIRSNSNSINNYDVLKRELPLLEEDITKEIEDMLYDVYTVNAKEVIWFENGEMVADSTCAEEMAVNNVCRAVYYKTPKINNEIINRAVVSTAQTKKTRINILNALLNHTDDEVFYTGTNQEATVYRSLFCGTGIITGNCDDSFKEILEIIDDFVNSCSDKKTSFTELISKLTSAPYGMRNGVIPFYIAYVLSKRNEDLIVYFSDKEVQINSEILVNVCEKPDLYFLYVSKDDMEKENYIQRLNALFMVDGNRALTDNRIKNIVLCMQRWFRALPQIARNLAGIADYINDIKLAGNMKTLKRMLQKVEFNPYEILFMDIPGTFGAEGLSQAFDEIKTCKEAYDNYFDWAIHRTIDGIYDVYGGKKKLDLYHLLKEWYGKQSDLSKQGLHSSGITSLMSCIEKLDVFNDDEIAQRVVKAVTNVYIENWIDNAYEDFIIEITEIKSLIEHIKEEKTGGKLLLSFTGSKGNQIERYYEKVDEGTGNILRNILEDTLDEYDDLSVNDRVGILLEMIEKIIG